MKNIIVIALLLCAVNISAQNDNRKLKAVYESLIEGETTFDNCAVTYYNRNGLPDSLRDNIYYVLIDYTYDNKNRIIKQEALYGESFANGTTEYTYYADSTVQKKIAGDYYIHTVVGYQNGDTSYVKSYTVGYDGFMRRKEFSEYHFRNKHLTKTVNSIITYNYFNETPEAYFYNIDTLLMNIKIPAINEEVDYTIEFTYDSENRLIRKTEKSTIGTFSSEYKYDMKIGKIVELIETSGIDTTRLCTYKYDKKKRRTEYEQTVFSKDDDNKKIISMKTLEKAEYSKKGDLLFNTFETKGQYSYKEYFDKGKPVKREEFDEAGKIVSTRTFRYEYYDE